MMLAIAISARADQVTTDTSLTNGKATTSTIDSGTSAAIVPLASDTSIDLWELVPSAWGVDAGSVGSTTAKYPRNGTVGLSVDYSSLLPNNAGVNGYDFIFYGGDQYGDQIGGQPPVFPEQLSSKTLTLDTTYKLGGTPGGDVDVLFDEWLIPTQGYNGGSSGAMEVEVLPFCRFAFGCVPCPTIKTFTEPITVNGTVTFVPFTEDSCQLGAGGDVLFSPASGNGFSNAEISFNMMDFLNEAATEASLSGWWVAGMELGTEYGDASSLNYLMTISKLEIDQQ